MPIFNFKKWQQDTGKNEVKFFLQDLNSTIDIGYWDDVGKQFMLDNPTGSFSRVVQYKRNVIIDGNYYVIPLKVSAEQQLRQAIKNIQAMQLNPLEYGYVVKKTGEGLNTKYELTVGEKGNQQLQKQINIKLPEPTPPEPQVVRMAVQELSKAEMEFINTYKQIVPKDEQSLSHFTESARLTAASGQMDALKTERAEMLFNRFVK